MEESLVCTSTDPAHRFWHALVTFGCAITVPKEEEEVCKRLVIPAVYAASLTNDLFSYQKEYEAAQRASLPDIVNGIWVLMHEHNITQEEAEAMCRVRIKEEVASYLRVVQETKASVNLSNESKRYIELMQYSVSGNVVWSLQCPRYHKDQKLSPPRTIPQMTNLADDLTPHDSHHEESCSFSSFPVEEHVSDTTDKLEHSQANGTSYSIAREFEKSALSSESSRSSLKQSDGFEEQWNLGDILSVELPGLGEEVSSMNRKRQG
jgi:hypothetical protein